MKHDITILAPNNSIFVYQYIKNVVIPYGFGSVSLIMWKRDKYCDYYEENNIHLYFYKDKNGHEIRKKLKTITRKINNCDVLHVHWGIWPLYVFWLLAFSAKSVVVTFWGSDLYRVGFIDCIKSFPMLCRTNIVHVMNVEMQNKINKRYCYIFNKKIRSFDFGCAAYDEIIRIEKSKTAEECKKSLGILPGSITISIGYNAIKEQQHARIIEQIGLLPSDVLNQITVILQFMYGDSDEEYKMQVEQMLQERRMDYVVLREYLSMEEIAVLRCATDVFLYGQTTDAISSSLCEHMFADSVVVKPDWLKYHELENKGIYYHEYGQFDEIQGLLVEILKDLNKEKELSRVNRDILWEYDSWQAVLPFWKSLYDN